MKRNFKKIIIITILLGTLLSLIVFTDLFNAREAEGAWYTTGGTWTNRKLITVDNTKVSGSSNLTDFPMLVSVTDNDLRHTGSGGKVGKTDGTDILFTSADGTTKLSHEIEKYVSSTGELVVWVKIPTLSYNTDTEIYMYYGNSEASDQQNKTGVWDSYYKAVYHLSESLSTASGNYKDSTSNANNLTLTDADADTITTSKFNGGLHFAGDADYLSAPSASSLNVGTNSFTYSFWHKRASYVWGEDPTLAQKANQYSSSNPGWNIAKSGSTVVFQYRKGGGTIVTLTSPTGFWNGGDWIHITMVYDASAQTMSIYRNGVLNTSNSSIAPANIDNTTPLGIGARYVGVYEKFDNREHDEHRYSVGIARSADWIATEYNNQNSPSTFYTISSEENPPIETDTITNVFIRNDGGSISWYTTGGTWTNRKLITVDNTKVSGSSNLTDFPMLVSVTDNDLRHTGSGGKVGKTDGTDILFTSADGTTKLSHEIEKYVSSTGELVAWVKIPTLSYSAETPIYMYFGNSGASDQQDATNVWDSNFLGVYHLPDGTTLSGSDSKNTYNGTVTGASATVGKFGGGASFGGGSNTHRIVTTSMPASGTSRTRSMWIYLDGLDSTTRRLYEIGSTGFRDAMQISTNTLDFGVAWSNTALWTTPSPSTLGWHYVVVTYDGGSTLNDPVIYINGQPASVSESITPSGTLSTTNQTLIIGNRADNARCFNGDIDEVRISDTIRSADWIATEYNNQSSPSSFYGYGGLESFNREAGSGGAPAKPVNVRGGVKFR